MYYFLIILVVISQIPPKLLEFFTTSDSITIYSEIYLLENIIRWFKYVPNQGILN